MTAEVLLTAGATAGSGAVEAPPTLAEQAAAAGLAVRATGAWPESTVDTKPPGLPGFVVSTFSPLGAEAASRCLTRAGDLAERTAIVLCSPLGDVTSAVHVAHAVDTGARVGPLLFFQSVPNAVAGHLAAQWGLTGPVACLGSAAGGLDLAALLIADGSADEALVVLAQQGEPDRATAVLVAPVTEGDGS